MRFGGPGSQRTPNVGLSTSQVSCYQTEPSMTRLVLAAGRVRLSSFSNSCRSPTTAPDISNRSWLTKIGIEARPVWQFIPIAIDLDPFPIFEVYRAPAGVN